MNYLRRGGRFCGGNDDDYISLNGNPLDYPPIHVYYKGKWPVFRYLKKWFPPSCEWNEDTEDDEEHSGEDDDDDDDDDDFNNNNNYYNNNNNNNNNNNH